jgi:hypothetical protein
VQTRDLHPAKCQKGIALPTIYPITEPECADWVAQALSACAAANMASGASAEALALASSQSPGASGVA